MPKTSLKLPVLDVKGSKVGEITLPKAIFGVKINPHLISQAVKVYLSNQRRAFPKAKDRSEVSGSRIKIWRQKGTGRARHGDRYAPIFVGGGVTHGPKGDQAYKLKMPKKMKQLALSSALSSGLQQGKIVVVKGLKKVEPKTKKANEMIKSVLGEKLNKKDNCLVVLPEKWEEVKRGFNNLPHVSLGLVDGINTYQVLNNKWLLFTEESILKLKGDKK